MPRKKDCLKSRCQAFYDAYDWEKVAFATFYWRVKVRKDEDWDSLISTDKREREPKVCKWRFDEEMNYWLAYKWRKPERHIFYGRLVRGYCKEEAILVDWNWEAVKKEKPRATNTTPHLKKVKKRDTNIEEEEYTWIDITYPKDVAMVFRKEFYNVIDRLESEIKSAATKEDVNELNDKLEMAKAELNLFNNYNH